MGLGGCLNPLFLCRVDRALFWFLNTLSKGSAFHNLKCRPQVGFVLRVTSNLGTKASVGMVWEEPAPSKLKKGRGEYVLVPAWAGPAFEDPL